MLYFLVFIICLLTLECKHLKACVHYCILSAWNMTDLRGILVECVTDIFHLSLDPLFISHDVLYAVWTVSVDSFAL